MTVEIIDSRPEGAPPNERMQLMVVGLGMVGIGKSKLGSPGGQC